MLGVHSLSTMGRRGECEMVIAYSASGCDDSFIFSCLINSFNCMINYLSVSIVHDNDGRDHN